MVRHYPILTAPNYGRDTLNKDLWITEPFAYPEDAKIRLEWEYGKWFDCRDESERISVYNASQSLIEDPLRFHERILSDCPHFANSEPRIQAAFLARIGFPLEVLDEVYPDLEDSTAEEEYQLGFKEVCANVELVFNTDNETNPYHWSFVSEDVSRVLWKIAEGHFSLSLAALHLADLLGVSHSDHQIAGLLILSGFKPIDVNYAIRELQVRRDFPVYGDMERVLREYRTGKPDDIHSLPFDRSIFERLEIKPYVLKLRNLWSGDGSIRFSEGKNKEWRFLNSIYTLVSWNLVEKLLLSSHIENEFTNFEFGYALESINRFTWRYIYALTGWETWDTFRDYYEKDLFFKTVIETNQFKRILTQLKDYLAISVNTPTQQEDTFELKTPE